MIGITYGIQPYGGHDMGWTSPFVLTMLFGGLALLVVFCVVERHVDEPMFHLSCSASGRSRPATWPRCWRRWAAAGCSSS